MGLKPLERQTLREKVVETIKNFILENRLKPGDRLPTEQELAVQLSVGRSSVREALKSLEMIGVLESRPKIGCLVKSVNMSRLTEHISFSVQVGQATMTELLEAREFLEANIIPLVVQKNDPIVFKEMAEGLEMMEEVLAGRGDRRESDEKFHTALFKGAHNSVLQSFNEVINGFFVRIRNEYAKKVPGTKEWFEDHKSIYEALKKKDAVLAQALMRAHLNRYADYGLIKRN